MHLTRYPVADPDAVSDAVQRDWEFILQLRQEAMLQLETLKRDQGMTNPLDARAVYHVDAEHKQMLERYGEDPADVLRVWQARNANTVAQR